MKKTRNLFVLIGQASDVSKVIADLQFKGTTFVGSKTSSTTPQEVFDNNKSIICTQNLSDLQYIHEAPIRIQVTSGSLPTLPDYIDITTDDIVSKFQDIATKYDCDIGDHKSNSSGLDKSAGITNCSYCKLFSNKSEQLIYKSANFYVVPTLGEFISGYLLIIPVKHVMSIAELDTAKREEFIDVLNDVKYILNLTYNSPSFLVWENGTGNSGIGKAKDSVVHSHVHIAPSMITPCIVQSFYGLTLKQICFSDLPKYNMHSYLLIRGDDDNTWFINDNPNVYIPRQFIRQLLAEEYSITPDDAWNWRTHPFRELMLQTTNEILTALKNNWHSLPDRIKTNTEQCLSD